MKPLEQCIAEHFLSQLSAIKTISAYSPTAEEIVMAIKLSYPAAGGGVYSSLTIENVIAAAAQLGLTVSNEAGRQVAVSKEDLRSRKPRDAYDTTLVCRHGFAPIQFDLAPSTLIPVMKPNCPRCANGFELPTKAEINQANRWLLNPSSHARPRAGALILAARHNGLTVTKPADGTLRIQKF